MGIKMRNLNQLILKFDYEKNFKDQDFYLSKSNEYSFKLLNSWPKWQKNFINLIGEKFSGKTHLINIFIEKFKGIKINAGEINNQSIKEIKLYENIVIEDLDRQVDENLFFTWADGTIKLWNIHTMECLMTYTGDSIDRIIPLSKKTFLTIDMYGNYKELKLENISLIKKLK